MNEIKETASKLAKVGILISINSLAYTVGIIKKLIQEVFTPISNVAYFGPDRSSKWFSCWENSHGPGWHYSQHFDYLREHNSHRNVLLN